MVTVARIESAAPPCPTTRIAITDPPRLNPATAGGLLLATLLFGVGLGLAIGSLIGAVAFPTLAGAAVGLAAGIALVYTRYRDL